MNNENTILNEDANIEELDSTWLQEFENLNNEYKNYYTEELSFIRIHTIYVNNENDIEKIREEKLLLKTPGILHKEELVGIIKHNCFSNQIKYSLLSILKFNIDIEPIHLSTFLRNKNKNVGSPFLQSVKNIDTIKFDKSISMFHDINDLLIIFHKKNNKYGSTNSTMNSSSVLAKQYTKKVFINYNSKKKTKRKELKEINT
jgi:hypothetical protein